MQHVRVVELASVLAGPSVGQFFAELGARVIKVENPASGGDVTRSWRSAGEQTDDRSAYFCCCNWGKEAVALDLTRTSDRARLDELISEADIVIASYKPGDAVKLGVDYERLKMINPRLIYGSVTGYGEHDPRVGYDAVIQAETGWMDLNGQPEGPPTRLPVAIVDLFAAHQLKEGLLLALFNRERTGQGDCVEVNLLHAALASLANQASNYLVGGIVPRRQGSAHPNIAPYGDLFSTRDGKRILLAVGTDRQFADLWRILVGPDVPEEFRTNAQRVACRGMLVGRLQQSIAKWVASDLLQQLQGSKIPAGQVNTVKEALDHPQASAIALHQDGLTGIRTYVARHLAFEPAREYHAPPHLPKSEK